MPLVLAGLVRVEGTAERLHLLVKAKSKGDASRASGDRLMGTRVVRLVQSIKVYKLYNVLHGRIDHRRHAT